MIATGILDGNLYRMNAKAIVNPRHTVNMATTLTLSWHEAHRRLGHISLTSMKQLFEKGPINGMAVDKSESVPSALNCESCIAAKAHRAPFTLNTQKRAEKFGDLTHSDV